MLKFLKILIPLILGFFAYAFNALSYITSGITSMATLFYFLPTEVFVVISAMVGLSIVFLLLSILGGIL